jgi:hypothetical protein
MPNSRIPVALIVAGLIAANAARAQEAPVYPSPDAALAAVVTALRDGPEGAVEAAFGPGSLDVISTGDADLDAQNKQNFLAMWDEGYSFETQADGTIVVDLGSDGWPFPIPLRKSDAGWNFDLAAGREELALRDIGYNEIDIIDLMAGYVRAQAEYRQRDYDGDGVMEFAAHILSLPGQRDGLYWPQGDSPAGDLIARAEATGYAVDGQDMSPEPYLGYYFRILDHQSANAPGGALPYGVNGNMVSGHALIAVPAEYGVSGITSFMVSENGRILEADLGEESIDAALAMDGYDPDDRWQPVN